MTEPSRVPTKEELQIKGMKWVVSRRKKLQILELTLFSHVELFLIAIRNSHAKHVQLVGRIPHIAERGQAKDYYAKDYKRSCFGSEIKGRKSWNLTSCTNTHNRLKVRNTSRICQKTIKPLSMRWAPTRKSCTSKPWRSSERSQKSYKSCNLHAVVMSDCSLIATRHSHAKTQ